MVQFTNPLLAGLQMTDMGTVQILDAHAAALVRAGAAQSLPHYPRKATSGFRPHLAPRSRLTAGRWHTRLSRVNSGAILETQALTKSYPNGEARLTVLRDISF